MIDTLATPPSAAYGKTYRYKAFLSYSHAADGLLAPALQNGLHRFARPLFRVRAMRVFRDATNLSASPGLWSSIEEALKHSEYFVLLASPDAARSKWVHKEIDFWLEQRAAGHLFIVLTDGVVEWEPGRRDFDWPSTTALPTNLRGMFSEEPMFLDLRWARTAEQLTLRNPKFRNCVADLAAPMHGRDKDELIGEDVRQQRRLKRIAWAAGLSMAALAGLALWQATVAIAERDRALTAVRVAVAWEYIEKDTDVSVALLREVTGPDTARGWRGATSKLRETLGVSTGAELTHKAAILNGRFSPDGHRVLTTSADGTARLWDAATGQAIAVLQHMDAVVAAYFSPNGRFVVTGSRDETARVWDASTGRELRLFSGHSGSLTSIAISPDGARLVTASSDKTARLWDLYTGVEVAVLVGHEGRITVISFSPDGRRVVTASSDGTAQLWDVATGQNIASLRGHTGEVNGIVFSPDGSMLASSSRDGTARLWDVATGESIATFRSAGAVYGVAFSPDVTRLVTSSSESTANIWDITEPLSAPVVLAGHSDAVVSAVFSPDGKRVVTASLDGTARLWMLDGLVDSIFDIGGGGLLGADYSPDGSKVLIYSREGKAQILDVLAPIESLSAWLRSQDIDCLAPSARSFLLGQSATAATSDYKACLESAK